MAKAVRLFSEEVARRQKIELADEEVYDFEHVDAFFLALHLDRSFEQGEKVASTYVQVSLILRNTPISVITLTSYRRVVRDDAKLSM